MKLASVTALAVLLAATAAQATCTYDIDSRVQVRHERLREFERSLAARMGVSVNDIDAPVSPLAGVKWRIQGRSRVGLVWGTWLTWDEGYTDSQGRFDYVDPDKSCIRRQVRIQVAFENDRQRVAAPAGWPMLLGAVLVGSAASAPSPWYDVFLAEVGSTNLTFDDPIVFRAPAANDMPIPPTLGEPLSRTRAEIWVLVSRLRSAMASLGAEYAFDPTPLIVVYPTDIREISNAEEQSFADPIHPNNPVYIHRNADGTRDQGNVKTVLHELMHVWAYQNTHGEDAMLLELVMSRDTHACKDETLAPFHEAFAEYASQQVFEMLFPGLPVDSEFSSPARPLSRRTLTSGVDCLGDRVMDDEHDLEHCENGWMSIFHTLTMGAPLFEYGDPVGGGVTALGDSLCREATKRLAIPAMSCGVSFADLLSVFLGANAVDKGDDLRAADLTLQEFLARAVDLDVLSAAQMRDTKDLLDPEGSLEAEDTSLCEWKLNLGLPNFSL